MKRNPSVKTETEERQYQVLRAKMKLRCDSIGVSWAGYFADKLDLGGINADQYLRNFFTVPSKRLNHEQLAIIYNELEDLSHIKHLTEEQLKVETLKAMVEVGNISKKIVDCVDGNGILTHEELDCIDVSKLKVIVDQFFWEVVETKANM